MALLQNVIQRGTHASRPAAGSQGILYFEVDTGQLFRDSGSAWQLDDTTLLYTAKGQLLASSASAAVGALAAGTDGYVLTADSAQTLGIKWAAAAAGGAMTQIASSVLGSSASNITFSSISGAYSSLRLDVQARGDTAATFTNLYLQVNGDTGTNYNSEKIYGHGTSLVAEEALGTAQWFPGYISAASAPSGAAGTLELVLHNYAGTTFRKGFTASNYFAFADTTTNLYTLHSGGEWKSTAAVTSLKIYPSAGNFIAGTVAYLYGIL